MDFSLNRSFVLILLIQYIAHYYIFDEQMKVLRSLNNTLYLVTGLFD